MYRKIITPTKQNRSIELPRKFFGKKVEVVVIELKEDTLIKKKHPLPPKGKKVTADELLEAFGTNPDFPSTEDLRVKAWPSEW